MSSSASRTAATRSVSASSRRSSSKAARAPIRRCSAAEPAATRRSTSTDPRRPASSWMSRSTPPRRRRCTASSGRPSPHSVALHLRELVWDGCLNVRDLGGHRTVDGSETRYGSVVRADSVRQLTDEGWTAAVDYGVRTVVDLREGGELEADPPGDVPVEVVHVPFLERDPAV